MLDSLDAAAVRRWCAAGLEALRRHQREIDELNVYPVPDGDTGTNLVLTVTSAYRALLDAVDAPDGDGEVAHAADGDGEVAQAADGGSGDARLGRALRAMARGALLGARGNSGVIVSQILRGVADTLSATRHVGGRALAAALREASTAAYAAVAVPVEGTLLTVARAAADAATTADSDDLATVARAAAAGASDALARTPELLPVLARAGVVDAGGRGLVVLLDALVAVVDGTVPEHPATAYEALRRSTVDREAGSESYAYEVQYLLDAPEAAVDDLRAALAGLGDSLAVVGTGTLAPGGIQTWNVHVHVNDIGAALEAGIRAGRPHRISVTRFADQRPAPDATAPAPPAAIGTGGAAPAPPAPVAVPPTPERAGQAAVVVAHGPGLVALFEGEGATVVPHPSPSTTEILDAVRSTRAERVVIFPNNPNVHAVAAAAAAEARAEGIRTAVVPTRSPVQALAALAVHDPQRRFDDDVIAMADSAGACRYAEVTVASREALTVAGRCRAGDILAMVDGEVNLIGKDLGETCRELLDRLLTVSGELVTLVLGEDAPDGLSDELAEHLRRTWTFVEVQAFSGGQPHYPLLVGVE
ncbi:MAG TPA: DAK2 domain-containing protein [Micromonosporaceae bacterium]